MGTAAPELRWTNTPVSLAQAFDLPLEAVVNGRVGAQEVLWFRFQGEAGQALGVRVEARELDSRLVPDLALTDAAGAELARVRRREWFDFKLPAKGAYFLKLNDSLYRGGDTHGFRLVLTAAPRVAFAVPQVLQAGRSQRVTLYGRRLPGGHPSTVLGADGEPLEQRDLEITAPAEASVPSATVEALGRPAASLLAHESWLWRFGRALAHPTGFVWFDAPFRDRGRFHGFGLRGAAMRVFQPVPGPWPMEWRHLRGEEGSGVLGGIGFRALGASRGSDGGCATGQDSGSRP